MDATQAAEAAHTLIDRLAGEAEADGYFDAVGFELVFLGTKGNTMLAGPSVIASPQLTASPYDHLRDRMHRTLAERWAERSRMVGLPDAWDELTDTLERYDRDRRLGEVVYLNREAIVRLAQAAASGRQGVTKQEFYGRPIKVVSFGPGADSSQPFIYLTDEPMPTLDVEPEPESAEPAEVEQPSSDPVMPVLAPGDEVAPAPLVEEPIDD